MANMKVTSPRTNLTPAAGRKVNKTGFLDLVLHIVDLQKCVTFTIVDDLTLPMIVLTANLTSSSKLYCEKTPITPDGWT